MDFVELVNQSTHSPLLIQEYIKRLIRVNNFIWKLNLEQTISYNQEHWLAFECISANREIGDSGCEGISQSENVDIIF